MKRYIIGLIIVLFLFVSASADHRAVIARKNAAVSCTASTPGNDNDEVGDVTVEANNVNASTTNILCYSKVADCTGTLAVGYAYHVNTDDSTIKVAVYSDVAADGAPTSSDLKIGYSGSINSTANEWATDSGTIGGNITSGSSYWICIAVSSGSVSNFRTKGAGSTTTYYTGNDFYATEPANLNGSWTPTASSGDLSVFVGIE